MESGLGKGLWRITSPEVTSEMGIPGHSVMMGQAKGKVRFSRLLWWPVFNQVAAHVWKSGDQVRERCMHGPRQKVTKVFTPNHI